MAKPRITNNLPRFVGRVQVQAARGMTQALVLGASEAAALTPIDSSVLLNSQFRDVRAEAARIVGTVGYVASYAAAVHDPSNKQNFRRPSAEKLFLAEGFARAEPAIRGVITGAIKTR